MGGKGSTVHTRRSIILPEFLNMTQVPPAVRGRNIHPTAYFLRYPEWHVLKLFRRRGYDCSTWLLGPKYHLAVAGLCKGRARDCVDWLRTQ